MPLASNYFRISTYLTKEDTVEYYRAMRPRQGIFAVLLALTSFRIADSLQSVVYMTLVVLNIFVTVGAIMVWNDYCDRDRDVARNKKLAHDNPKKYLRFSISLWCASGVLSLGLLFFSWQAFVLTVFIGLLGWLYSVIIIKIPMLPTITVASLSSAVIFYPACLSGDYKPELGHLAQMTFCLIFARDLMSDIGDVEIDKGHKVTIPGMFGVEVAIICITVALAALIVSIYIAAPTIGDALALSMIVFVCVGVIYRFLVYGYKEGRSLLDRLVLISLLIILAFGGF